MDFFQIGINLITLTIFEIILGIDNLVFLAIVTNRLPSHQQKIGRRIGLLLALFGRLVLLVLIMWIIQLNRPVLHLLQWNFSGRDIFMILGGVFLLSKATWEIHQECESLEDNDTLSSKTHITFLSALIQVVIFDAIFSLDSILTAVGLTNELWIMMIAIVIAIVIMIVASEPLSLFIKRNATIKMLALSFLVLISVVLIADGFGYAIPKGYIYFSICFSLFFEFLNSYRKRRAKK